MTNNPICTFAESLSSSGRGQAEHLEVFPGVELFVIHHYGEKSDFHHEDLPGILQINHCLEGRVGWDMRNGISVYFGAGDLTLHTMDHCAISSMSTPLGHYKGIVISVDLEQFAKNLPDILREADIQVHGLLTKLCPDGKPCCLPSSPEIDSIFSVLCGLPEHLYVPYCKLKVQELFLYLERLDLTKEKTLDQYYSVQVEQIKEIHDLLVQNLDKRFTIEALSKQYLMNTSSLKSIFKAVYGQPIASYMKGYRIRRAMELLRTTNDSIAAIAKSLSYENQGKFTKAFKDIVHIAPTEYRRHYKKIDQKTSPAQER